LYPPLVGPGSVAKHGRYFTLFSGPVLPVEQTEWFVGAAATRSYVRVSAFHSSYIQLPDTRRWFITWNKPQRWIQLQALIQRVYLNTKE